MKHLIAALVLLTAPAAADVFTLDAETSSVAFIASADGFRVTGNLPVTAGEVVVDFDNVSAAKIDVTVSTTKVRTGFALATSAVKSAALLDTAAHPEMRFRAREILREGQTATVKGDLTVKSITRPVTLNARFVRTAESDPNDLSRLGVQLTGSVDRKDFGILGYPSLVEDTIAIDITAWLDRVDGCAGLD